MADDIARVLNAVSIETYISRFVSLKRKGNTYWGLCPFHAEKTPSFAVSAEKGIFKCFGCGKGGNVITFVMLYEKVEFLEALKILANYAGISLTGNRGGDAQKKEKQDLYRLLEWVKDEYQKALAGSVGEKYLNERGISPEAVRHFVLGYAPATYRFLENALANSFRENTVEWQKNYQNLVKLGLIKEVEGESYNLFRDRLIFPIKNTEGKYVGFGGRVVQEKENTGKYINSPESFLFQKKDLLFHLYEAKESIRKEGLAILVEGYFDVLGLWEKEIRNVVAPLGTAFTLSQAKLLKRYTDRLMLFLDQDHAGFEAAFRAIKVARQASLVARVVHIDSSEKQKLDPFDISRKYSRQEILLLLDQAKDELEFILWYFFEFKYDMKDLFAKKQALREFFQYISSFREEFEKEAYLKSAAEFLNIQPESLIKDFKRGNVSLIREERTTKKQNDLRKKEIGVLLLLLTYPELLGEEATLEYFFPKEEDVQKLYQYLLDRYHQGDIIKLQSLTELFHVFQTEHMHGFLAELGLDERINEIKSWSSDRKEIIKERFRREVFSLHLVDLQKDIQQMEQNFSQKAEVDPSEFNHYLSLVSRRNKINQYLRTPLRFNFSMVEKSKTAQN